jgi:hypothetical protein
MNDTALLLTGIGVFGLMLIAIVMTVLEFRQLSAGDKRGGSDPAAGRE